ncbi:hypothetical protein HMPREF1872_01405 [Amygdalobacter nucleatus]|uniref:Uncharacterized protein n=1 Tax=Amygdalobacter nucleatus TaxID=3029274 RepID=A0A133Y6U5_9FIRM|nr:hypothetical protein HMPREF1872_01405 [Amygdalobacter nucleatus]
MHFIVFVSSWNNSLSPITVSFTILIAASFGYQLIKTVFTDLKTNKRPAISIS